MTLETIAERILSLRDTLGDSPECLYKDIAYWDARMREGTVQQHCYVGCKLSIEGGLYFNTSIKQPIYDIDFGSGAPVWYETPGREMGYRSIRAFPAPEKNGDIILYVTLPEPELTRLSKHLDSVFNSTKNRT